MHDIYDCVKSFIPLLDTQYEFQLGRKGTLVELRVAFDKKDCFHLMGLQYLKDCPRFKQDRATIFDKILTGVITVKDAESSVFYNEIRERVSFFPYLEQLLDSNDTVFKYNTNANRYSKIKAEYLLKNNICAHNVFLFLDKNKNGCYYGRSFFPEHQQDYTKGQALWTLLSKKKIKISTGEQHILYSRYKNK